MLRADNSLFIGHFCSERLPCRDLARPGGSTLAVVRLGVTEQATCSSSSASVRNYSTRRHCLSDLSDATPVPLDNVTLEELLAQVGAGEPRGDVSGLVLIESNPHPSLLQRYTNISKPFERGRTLPIPMPHKLTRPVPLPLLRRNNLPRNRNPKPSPSPPPAISSYPRLFAKLLIVPDDEVRMVLDAWKGRVRCKSDAISNLMLQLAKQQSTGKALQLFAWAREQPRMWPDDNILLASILVVLSSRKLTLANKFLTLYGPLSSQSTLIAADAYAEQGYILDALSLLEESGACGSPELYAKMIVRGSKEVVQDLLLVARDFKLEDCARVMAACSKLGLDNEVEMVFERYIAQGYKANIVMYTTLMQARDRAGKVRQALAVFWNMEEAGVKPDLVAYRVMIRLCEKVGDVNRAVKVYNQMRLTGFVPTSDVYNVMIRLYCKEGRLAKAKEVIREMEMWGCVPSSETNQQLFLAGYKQPGSPKP